MKIDSTHVAEESELNYNVPDILSNAFLIIVMHYSEGTQKLFTTMHCQYLKIFPKKLIFAS